MKNHLNISNQFVPYELALKLKELGFNEKCLGGYDKTKKWWYHPDSDVILDVPLWQQAEDFMLKRYNLYGIVIPTITMDWTFKTMTVVEGIVEVPPYNHVDANDYSTREEARLECLKKLIELCNKK